MLHLNLGKDQESEIEMLKIELKALGGVCFFT